MECTAGSCAAFGDAACNPDIESACTNAGECPPAIRQQTPHPHAEPTVSAARPATGYEELASPPSADGGTSARQSERLSAREREVRDVVEEELADLTAEERSIWFDELRSLPAEIVRDLLQVRQQQPLAWQPPTPQFRLNLDPTRSLHLEAPRAELANNSRSPTQLFTQPVETKTALLPEAGSRVDATFASRSRETDFGADGGSEASLARRVIQHNLANVQTPGYRRLKVQWRDRVALPEDRAYRPSALERVMALGGAEVASLEIDPTPARNIVTDRALDLAIAGPGWFQVSLNGKAVFTRCGSWIFDSSNHLVCRCLPAAQLEPAIVLPPGTTFSSVTSEGQVIALDPATQTEFSVGQIQLVRLRGEEQLQTIGNSLYEPGECTSSPAIGMPGSGEFGRLTVGALETSNVDLAIERAELANWNESPAATRSVSLPRTATSPHESPR